MIGTLYMLLDGRGFDVWLYEKPDFILYLKWLPNSSLKGTKESWNPTQIDDFNAMFKAWDPNPSFCK